MIKVFIDEKDMPKDYQFLDAALYLKYFDPKRNDKFEIALKNIIIIRQEGVEHEIKKEGGDEE